MTNRLEDCLFYQSFQRDREYFTPISLPTLRVATPEGVEPPTNGVEVRCSIQLSYGASWQNLLGLPFRFNLDALGVIGDLIHTPVVELPHAFAGNPQLRL